jgi:hypothetical protein
MMRRPPWGGSARVDRVQNLDTRGVPRGGGLSTETIDRWAVPLLSLLGGLGLAFGSIYLDSLRRRPSTATPEKDDSRSRGRLVETALILIALGWSAHQAAPRFGGALALLGYGSLAAGIAALALYVLRNAPPSGNGPAAGT